MKRLLLIFILLFTLSAGCGRVFLSSPAKNTVASLYNQTITVKNKPLNVQIVSTPEEMEQGLSGRSILASDAGMLFDLSELQDKRPGFWMKDMKFNLDLIWIKNKKIIGITPNVTAPVKNWSAGQRMEIGNLLLYYPPSDVDMVLEVNAWWCKQNQINVGDDVILEIRN